MLNNFPLSRHLKLGLYDAPLGLGKKEVLIRLNSVYTEVGLMLALLTVLLLDSPQSHSIGLCSHFDLGGGFTILHFY